MKRTPKSRKPAPVELLPEPYLIGYARVSTAEQNLDMQLQALQQAGCNSVYQEKASAGGKTKRPQLDLAIAELRPGDTLVVWRLDRVARNIRELYRRMDDIAEAGAKFISLTERFDFSTATGKLILGFLALMAEFERQLTIERTRAGMKVLKEKGVPLGAARIVDDKLKSKITGLMLAKRRDGKWKYSNKKIAAMCGISEAAIYTNFKGGRKAVARKAKRKGK